MFKNTFHSGLISILYSIGSKPLEIWETQETNGRVEKIMDEDITSSALELEGINPMTTYITCPADPNQTLGITLPFVVMIIKNLKKDFSFEVQILDDRNIQHRYRCSTYRTTTSIAPSICTMPLKLDENWNQIQFNLSDFTVKTYGTNYAETQRVQIHANCRVRRVYFCDRLYTDDELPAEFKFNVKNTKAE